jgi:hypothetical protein
MRTRIVRLIFAALLALTAAAAGTAAALPTVRHFVSGLWNVPDRLPALSGNSQVHYEPGADRCARAVSAELPAAIARIEALQNRPFAHPVTLGVYATLEAYAAANGAGSSRPAGVTFFGRVNLSPALCSSQRPRLPAILTHELSLAHIRGWLSVSAYVHLPNWFKEGLAVMVSGGRGAEIVSEDEARAAIQRGEHIAISETGSLLNLTKVRFEHPPPGATPYPPAVLAYRQAGMFMTYLRDSDGPAFTCMMNAILDGQPFAEAVTGAYRQDVRSLGQKFARTNAR